MRLGRPRKHDDDRNYATRTEWYQSRGWLTQRVFYGRLVGDACERCGGKDRIEVHHKVDPFPERDIMLLLRFDNLEALCASCHRVEHNDEGASTVCETCGTTVRHNPAQKHRRFCSIPCRDKHPDFVRRADRVCPECASTFQPKTATQLRCSRYCAAAYTARVKRERAAIG